MPQGSPSAGAPESDSGVEKWKFESARGYAPLAPRVPVDMPEGTRSLLKPDKWGDFPFAVIIL